MRIALKKWPPRFSSVVCVFLAGLAGFSGRAGRAAGFAGRGRLAGAGGLMGLTGFAGLAGRLTFLLASLVDFLVDFAERRAFFAIVEFLSSAGPAFVGDRSRAARSPRDFCVMIPCVGGGGREYHRPPARVRGIGNSLISTPSSRSP
jgi:hypothetical protein